MSEPSVTLPTGASMPLTAFGTRMESRNDDPARTVRIIRIIEDAIDVGYRHFDTATLYNTEKEVGQAIQNKIKQGVIKREDVFITTKLWRNAYGQKDVVPALKLSLQALGLPYLDLFLIHWPNAFKSGENKFPKNEDGSFIYADIDYLDTWRGMEECLEQGLAKAVGLSNFNSKQIQRILDNSSVKPANHQVESHPFFTNSKIIEYCQAKGISVTAHTPLAPNHRFSKGLPTIFTDDRIKKIADKHGKTPAQVALRFQLERNVCVIPKSANKERMEQNFASPHFRLDADDMKAIQECNQNLRLNDEFPDHPHYPFHEEF